VKEQKGTGEEERREQQQDSFEMFPEKLKFSDRIDWEIEMEDFRKNLMAVKGGVLEMACTSNQEIPSSNKKQKLFKLEKGHTGGRKTGRPPKAKTRISIRPSREVKTKISMRRSQQRLPPSMRRRRWRRRCGDASSTHKG